MRPRSGLARKFGISLPNAPGTIDSDYRGEVLVLLVNLGTEPFIVEPGDRVAQMVIAPVVIAELEEAATLTTRCAAPAVSATPASTFVACAAAAAGEYFSAQ